MKKEKFDLDRIVNEFSNQNRDDRETIQAVLVHCPLNFKVSFALRCALDVEYLMTDIRSKQALRAVELFLSEGVPIPQETINAAYAAAYYAAYYASYAYYAAYYASYAYYAAAYASYAYYAAAANAYNPNIYKEKMREYLLKLKESILAEIPSEEISWLLAIAM